MGHLKNIEKYKVLKGFIENLKARYNVNINIHDIVGVSDIDTEITEIFSQYLYHNNSFCNYVKKNDKCFPQCIASKNRLCSYCNYKRKHFFGSCFMGVEEFVFPVFLNQNLVLVICAGQFYTDIERSMDKVVKASAIYGLDEKTTVDRFLKNTKKVDFSLDEFYNDIGFLGEYIASIYLNFIYQGKAFSRDSREIDQAVSKLKNNSILNNSIKFIKENYNKDITLDIISFNCYCNATYLSHIFKEKMKINIRDYINMMRIDAAKHLMDTTSKTITEISLEVGYNDSSYFSRVFNQVEKSSPKTYRSRNI